jgi:hypothetical protein
MSEVPLQPLDDETSEGSGENKVQKRVQFYCRVPGGGGVLQSPRGMLLLMSEVPLYTLHGPPSVPRWACPLSGDGVKVHPTEVLGRS